MNKKVKVKNHSVVSDSLRPHGLWNSPGQNNEVGSLSLLQGIFLTQGSNPGLLQSRQIETQGKPEFNYYHHLLLAMSSWAKCLAPLNVCKVSILASAPLLPGTVVTIADIIIMLYNRCMAMNFT